ncbi:Thiamin-phosphate pyrophosphorylase [hydrothermal vent metagenome]|uniref:thiamine phosphate synthase n=1 Tax=hydrothermal vent metagenome TaxID=652676 RepID=A0A3B1DU26_9ZZZZ
MGCINKLSLNSIYAITDTKLTPYENILSFLIPAFEGGVKVLQLRDKHTCDVDLLPYALKIQEVCKKYNVLFILNDRYHLAQEIKADGVHLGIDDVDEVSFAKIRDSFDAIIGISCYGDINRAVIYQELGADYVAFGSCFASSTKTSAKQISLNILQEAKNKLTIPICAIGGININNITKIKKYNTDMIAIISDIWQARDIKEKVELLDRTI